MDIFKENHLAKTRQRELVLNLLEQSDRPVSAEEIFGLVRDQAVSLSAVYRILEAFEEKKIVLKISANDRNQSLFYRNTATHEHYLTCSRCKQTVKIDICPICELEKKLTRDTGFHIFSHQLTFTALCPKCMELLK